MNERTYNGVVTDWILDYADAPQEDIDDFLALQDEPHVVQSQHAAKNTEESGCFIAVAGILLAVVLPMATLALLLWPGGSW